jgi:hypothetical protein
MESRELLIRPEQELELKINKDGENLTFSIWDPVSEVFLAASSTKSNEIISRIKINVYEDKPQLEQIQNQNIEKKYGIKVHFVLISGYWEKITKTK